MKHGARQIESAKNRFETAPSTNTFSNGLYCEVSNAQLTLRLLGGFVIFIRTVPTSK